jgi:hypothetical protein
VTSERFCYPHLPTRSLLQLRARFEMSKTAATMDQLVVDE